jgi:hypothetical protein
MIETRELKLPNYGVLLAKIPDALLQRLKQQVERAQCVPGTSYTNMLVGALKREDLLILEPALESFVLEVADQFFDKYIPDEQIVDASITTAWVNYQQRYEYNPLHDHTGMLSFVIWVSIPYDIEEERNFFPSRKKDGVRSSAAFQLMYNAIDGSQLVYDIPVSKEYEGMMIMFTANMKHQVYPFLTVDGTRISVAGNIGPTTVDF